MVIAFFSEKKTKTINWLFSSKRVNLNILSCYYIDFNIVFFFLVAVFFNASKIQKEKRIGNPLFSFWSLNFIVVLGMKVLRQNTATTVHLSIITFSSTSLTQIYFILYDNMRDPTQHKYKIWEISENVYRNIIKYNYSFITCIKIALHRQRSFWQKYFISFSHMKY